MLNLKILLSESFVSVTIWNHLLKVVSTTLFPVYFVRLKDNTLETRKNVFYVTSKALFVLEIIIF